MLDALRLLGSQGLELDALLRRLLERLPAVDWREVHRLADQITGRDGETGFAIATAAIYDWLSRAGGGAGRARPRRAGDRAASGGVGERSAAAVRETEALNLDKRPLVLAIVSDLAAAVRLAG